MSGSPIFVSTISAWATSPGWSSNASDELSSRLAAKLRWIGGGDGKSCGAGSEDHRPSVEGDDGANVGCHTGPLGRHHRSDRLRLAPGSGAARARAPDRGGRGN